MVSLIDFSKPIYGSPTTQSVRDNFQIAQTEITNLQQFIANGPFLPLDGGTMTGKLELWRHPVSNLEAATKQYVDDIAFAGGGMPDAPRNGFYYVRGGGYTTQATENEWIIDPIFNSLKLWDANKAIMFGMSYDVTYNFYGLDNVANYFRFNRLTKLLELIINGAINAGFSDTAITFNRHIVSTGGIDFGSVAVTDFSDITKHIALHSAGYGINVSAFRVNYITGGTGAHVFMEAAIERARIDTTGLVMGPATAITLVADPTTALHAASKQYVDTKAGQYLPLAGGALTGPTHFNNDVLFSYNSSSVPNPGNSGYIKWNVTLGHGDVGFINSYSGASNAFTWLLVTGVGVWNQLATLTSSGAFKVNSVSLGRDPTNALEATTKQYVDTKAGQYLPLIGGTVTGPTTFNQSLNVGTGTSNATVIAVNAASTTAPGFAFYINGSQRWLFAMDHWPETGGATGVGGGGFVLHSYTNNGGYRGEIMGFARDTGMMILSMATLRVARDPTTGLEVATKQYVDVSATNSGINSSYNVGRNLIHNPLFNIAQRGAGPFTMAGYTLDRWLLSLTGDAANVSAGSVSDAVRTQIGDEAATNYLLTTFTGTAGAAAVTAMLQPIEGVQRISGKTVTVSFFAWASTALKLGVSLDQNFGSGGSPSASVNGAGVAVTLSSTASRYSVTLAVPSTIGKTLGTQGGDKSFLLLWLSSGANNATRAGNVGVQSGSIAIWGVQLEIGSVRTPLEKPDPRYDLSNCQRFYATGNVSLYAYNTAGSYVTQMVSLPVPMRASPTIVPTLIPTNLNTVSMDMQSNYQPRVVGVVTATGNCSVLGTFTASADL